jgi:hypothetical protein
MGRTHRVENDHFSPVVTAATAAANPRQGNVSEQGLASFPMADTKVRCGAAAPAHAAKAARMMPPRSVNTHAIDHKGSLV